MSKKFTPNIPDSTHPFQNVTFVKGDRGYPAQFCIPSIAVLAVPTDADGNNGVFTYAVSHLRIIEAGKVIANEGLLNGWSISDIDREGCTASGEGTLTFNLLTLTADTGYADITISKTGQSDLFVRIHFFKSKAGATGPAGATGAQGIQGITGSQGVAGTDGDGIIVIKKTVGLKSDERAAPTTEGAGGKIICTTAGAHDVVQGEKIRITSSVFSLATYKDGLVTSIIGANSFLTDIDYEADDATSYFYSFWYFRSFSNGSLQSVHFDDLIPARYKILSVNVYCTVWDAGNPGSVYLYCGSAAYPSSGWYDYMSNVLIDAVAAQQRVDLSDGFFTLDIDPDEVSFYLSAATYPASFVSWNDLVDLEIDFMVVCEKLD